MRYYVIHNVIHTKSIYRFVSNTILTYEMSFLQKLLPVIPTPRGHGISELRYLFVWISGNGHLLNLRTPYLLHL